MKIELRPITAANWRQCAHLAPAEGQRHFVASNPYSLAESRFEKNMFPMAIYDGEEMVGFVMYALDADDGNYWIKRLMVAEGKQKKGYGRKAMEMVIERIKNETGCRSIMISFVPENSVAERLYESLGFKRTGEIIYGEAVARLDLP